MNLVSTDKKSSGIEDLVDKCKKKSRISSSANKLTFLLESSFQLSVAPVASTLYSNSATIRPTDKKMNQFIEIIQSLVLLVRTLQTHVEHISLSKTLPNIAQTAPNYLQRSRSDSNFLKKVDKYHYYWGLDHYLKRDCRVS